MVDVSTMRNASPISLLTSIISVASHVDLGLNLGSLRYPQRSGQKVHVDIESIQDNTPAGPCTPKEVVDQPATQQEYSVIDQTDLKTDKADVEPVLG
jgi:hypothetical protein